MKNAPDVSGRTRNKDNGVPNGSRFANEKKRDGDPLIVDNTQRFAAGQPVVFRLSGDGPAKSGSIAEVVEASEEHPYGGLFRVALDDGDRVEAWWEELELVDYTQRFAAGQPVVFRESGDGPAEPGSIAEVYDASDAYPNGGLFRVALADGGTVEAWCGELSSDDSARFTLGQTVSVRLPGVGEMTGGTIEYAFEPDKEFPNGGMFQVNFPHGLEVEAAWTDITAAEPEPDERRYVTGGGLLREPMVYNLERDGELIAAVKSGENEYRVTGDLGSVVFRVEGPYVDDMYAGAARAYDQFAVETLEAEVAATTAKLDVFRKRVGA